VEPSPSHSAATLDAVAARAGVSRATASRVLTGSPKVSESARVAVMTAADELSYVANPAARSLAKRRSDSIAFVVVESEDRLFTDPFFAAALRGVQGVLAERELQLLFVVVANERDAERFLRFASQGHVDGAILLSVHGEDPLPNRLRERGVRVVLSGRPYDASPTCSSSTRTTAPVAAGRGGPAVAGLPADRHDPRTARHACRAGPPRGLHRPAGGGRRAAVERLRRRRRLLDRRR
jgi:DNA-binding LacI/PurR family transcriptional regulator